MSSVLGDITNFNHGPSVSLTSPASCAQTRLAKKRKERAVSPERSVELDLSEFSAEELADLIGTDTDSFSLEDSQFDFEVVAAEEQIASPPKVRKTVSAELPSFQVVSDMVQNLVDKQEKMFGNIDDCALLFPIQVKFAKIGYKCPILHVPWEVEVFQDPPFFEFCDQLYFLKGIKYNNTVLEQRDTFCNNVFGVLHGDWLPLPGDRDISHTRPHTFYGMSSLCTNSCAQGLYMDVSGTCFRILHETIDNENSNCEVISVVDVKLQCEVLLLAITRTVDIGEPLILSGLHKHNFGLNARGHGRKLTWFQDLRNLTTKPRLYVHTPPSKSTHGLC